MADIAVRTEIGKAIELLVENGIQVFIEKPVIDVVETHRGHVILRFDGRTFAAIPGDNIVVSGAPKVIYEE